MIVMRRLECMLKNLLLKIELHCEVNMAWIVWTRTSLMHYQTLCHVALCVLKNNKHCSPINSVPYHAHQINVTDLFWFPVTGHQEQIIMFSRQIVVKITSQPYQPTVVISLVISHLRKFTQLFVIVIPESPGVVNWFMKSDNWSMCWIHSNVASGGLKMQEKQMTLNCM